MQVWSMMTCLEYDARRVRVSTHNWERLTHPHRDSSTESGGADGVR